MREFLIFVFVVLLVVALAVAGVVYYQVHFARSPIQRSAGGAPVEVVFEVQAGESTAEIAQHLADQGLIRSASLFQVWARIRRMDGRLEAGRYTLRSDMTMDQILEQLTHAPENREIIFTTVEGLRLEEMAASLEKQGVCSAADFLAAVQQSYDYDFLADRPAGATLEGYLFPDTYSVLSTYTATRVVNLMLEDFGRRLTPEMRRQARERGLTIHDLITLASIVDKEAVLDEERPIIASVYLNRLAAEMPLQACPTAQYALGYDPETGRWWRELDFGQLGVTNLAEIDHPYNTYRYQGLPPGPICSPGLASMMAVLEPAETDYYYFVAKNDGSNEHAFARTLEEHNANIARYQP